MVNKTKSHEPAEKLFETAEQKILMPLDIQFFADGGESTNPEVNPTGVENQGDNNPTPSNVEQTTYTEEDFNKRLQEEIAKITSKHQEDLEAARKEAETLAKMNADEKAQYELEKREQELAAKEKEIAQRELRAETLKTLADPKNNLPAEALEFVIAEDAETTNKKIQVFKEFFDKAVQSAVEQRLAGKSPQVGNVPTQKSEIDKVREEFEQGLGGL